MTNEIDTQTAARAELDARVQAAQERYLSFCRTGQSRTPEAKQAFIERRELEAELKALDLSIAIEAARVRLAECKEVLERAEADAQVAAMELTTLEVNKRAADQNLFVIRQGNKPAEQPAAVETVEAKSLYTIHKDRYWDDVDAELAKLGYKRAFDQPGWYVTVVVDGQAVKVWATDGK